MRYPSVLVPRYQNRPDIINKSLIPKKDAKCVANWLLDSFRYSTICKCLYYTYYKKKTLLNNKKTNFTSLI